MINIIYNKTLKIFEIRSDADLIAVEKTAEKAAIVAEIIGAAEAEVFRKLQF